MPIYMYICTYIRFRGWGAGLPASPRAIAAAAEPDLGFEVQGLGFRVWGLGFEMWGLGFGGQGVGSRGWGLGFEV